MIYELFYKCRRCGEIEITGTAPSFLSVAEIIKGNSGDIDIPLLLVWWHTCEDGNVGITDFIGAENHPPNKEEQESDE